MKYFYDGFSTEVEKKDVYSVEYTRGPWKEYLSQMDWASV